MHAAKLHSAIETLNQSLAEHPELEEAVRDRWRRTGRSRRFISPEVREAADVLVVEIPAVMGAEDASVAVDAFWENGGGELVLVWCSASAWRVERTIVPDSPLLLFLSSHSPLTPPQGEESVDNM